MRSGHDAPPNHPLARTRYWGRPGERLAGRLGLAASKDTILQLIKQAARSTILEVRAMFHRTPHRIEAHVKLCGLALQMQGAAEFRCQLRWARIAHMLGGLKAVRYRCEGRAIV